MADLSGLFHYYGNNCGGGGSRTNISNPEIRCNPSSGNLGNIHDCALFRPGYVFLTKKTVFSDSLEYLESLGCSNITSGNFYYTSCAEDPIYNGCVVKDGCFVGNNFYDIGYSSTFYKSSSVPFDQKCESEVRTCGSNGIMDGSYENSSCYVEKVIKSDQVQSMGTAVTTAGSGLVHIGIQLLPYAIALTIILILFVLVKNRLRLRTKRQLNSIKRQKTRAERREIKRYKKK